MTQFDTKLLRNAFGCFPSGVTIVTLKDSDNKPTGITVSSFSSLSLDPPLCLFSIGKEQASRPFFETSDHFVVNVLCAEQESIAWQFAKPIEDKFENVNYTENANGMPIINGNIAHFCCKKWALYEGGDQIILVGEVLDFNQSDSDALIFFKGKIDTIANPHAT